MPQNVPLFLLSLLGFAACAHDPRGDDVSGGGTGKDDAVDTALDSVPVDTHLVETGAADSDSSASSEDADGCEDIYDPELFPAFSIEITDAEWAGIEADYASGSKNYHPIVFRYGDEVVADAMIRLKGNPGFSWFMEKKQFVIAFNEVNPDGRFHGLRKIALDASWYEPTLVRDRVAWRVIRRANDANGDIPLPFACSNSATLDINGAYYGVYTNIEFLDHEWLERSFGDENAGGTLWKYGYDPVANAEASDGAALSALASTTDPTALSTLGNVEQWLYAWAAEAVLGDDDGYWCCNHNFYVYEHPTQGLLFVDWDLDDAFDVQGYDVDPISGYPEGGALGLFQQPHFLSLVNDPIWGPKYVDAVEALNNAMDPAITVADIDAWEAQVGDALLTDPNRSVGWEEHVTGTERMRDWVYARHAFITSWVACQRGGDGALEDADGDGASVCTDPDDNNSSVHPGAVETCNGVDDDADGWIDDGLGASCDDCIRHDFDDRNFLFCREPRTNADAEANCAARGGTLTEYQSTGEYYVYFFYTWPVLEPWWTGTSGTALCSAWDESTFSEGLVRCSEAHPSICAVP